MKKIHLLAIVAALLSCAVLAETSPAPSAKGAANGRPQIDPARRAAAKARIIAKRGGLIRKPGEQAGAVGFVNAAGASVDEALLKSVSASFGKSMSIEAKTIAVESLPKKGLAGEMKRLGLNAAVFVVANDDCDLPLLYAPEQNWAIVNVKALVAAAPTLSADRQKIRLERELRRALGYACGAGSSMSGEGIMGATSLPELETCFEEYETEVVARFNAYLKKIGVRPYYETYYRDACEEGWAPPPTNEYQKAIWDRVHTIPTKPLKIEYNEKRDKGK